MSRAGLKAHTTFAKFRQSYTGLVTMFVTGGHLAAVKGP